MRGEADLKVLGFEVGGVGSYFINVSLYVGKSGSQSSDTPHMDSKMAALFGEIPSSGDEKHVPTLSS